MMGESMTDAPASTTQAMLERLRSALASWLANMTPQDRESCLDRFDRYGPDAVELLAELYGERSDFAICLEAIFETAAKGYLERPTELKALDSRREAEPRWYQHHGMVGGVCYVRQFAGTLSGIRDRVGYFNELGLTYLHLMPLFRTPPPPDDGAHRPSAPAIAAWCAS